MQKVHLIFFATSDFKRSKRRFIKQAKSTKWYESIFSFDEEALKSLVNESFNQFVDGRGFGYWKWKPLLIYQRLSQLNKNDILHYCDVGCFLRKEGSTKFYDYIKLLSDNDCLFFETCPSKLPKELTDERNFPIGIEECWTKEYVFKYFNVLKTSQLRKHPAYGATTFFIKKNNKSMKFFKKFADLAISHPNLFNDNLLGFDQGNLIEHRHDQSVLSIMLKTRKNLSIAVLSGFENWYPSKDGIRADWYMLRKSPIWIKRDRSNNLLDYLTQKAFAILKVIYIKLLRPLCQ